MRWLHDFFFGGTGVGSTLGDLALAIFRIGTGLLMGLGHGWDGLVGEGRFGPEQRLVDGVTQMGFPAPTLFAWLAVLAESLAAYLIVAGLMTRPAALMLTINMGVAVFIAHRNDPWTGMPPSKEWALLYFLPALLLLFTGAGRFSIDHFLRGGRRAPTPASA